jgi:hypothetical protein
MRVRTLLATAVIAASAALAACSGDNVLGLGVAGAGGGTNTDTLSNARIRFVNATSTSLDLATGGVVATGNGAIGYGASSSCVSTSAIAPNLAVRIAGTTSSVPGFTTGYQSGASYTVIAYPGSGGATQFATITDTFTPTSGESGFRVFNASSAGSSYDVYVTAPGASLTTAVPTAASVTSGSSSSFTGVSPTVTQQVRITPAGSRTVLLDMGNVAFVAGLNLTLVIAPPLTGSTTPRTFLAASC